ncbi:delta adaptin [Pelomyxa schiedti]|nr:delta adaptin [Pelomyxa schiedti]
MLSKLGSFLWGGYTDAASSFAATPPPTTTSDNSSPQQQSQSPSPPNQQQNQPYQHTSPPQLQTEPQQVQQQTQPIQQQCTETAATPQSTAASQPQSLPQSQSQSQSLPQTQPQPQPQSQSQPQSQVQAQTPVPTQSPSQQAETEEMPAVVATIVGASTELVPYDVMAREINEALCRGYRVVECIGTHVRTAREELAAPLPPYVKAETLKKLVHIHTLGYNVQWASFYVVEAMSSPKLSIKRAGYLAANQWFNSNVPELMLTVNILKREFTSRDVNNILSAINCVSCTCTPDLAHEVAADIQKLIFHRIPQVRKRAMLCMYNICLNYPDVLKSLHPHLAKCVNDEDAGVAAAAVCMIAELAKHNPRNFLSLTPILFNFLEKNHPQNITICKLLKLFGLISSQDHRIARVIADLVMQLLQRTESVAVEMECISTCIKACPEDTEAMRLCAHKLSAHLSNVDPNLKYLALSRLHLLTNVNPVIVEKQFGSIIACLEERNDAAIMNKIAEILPAISTQSTTKKIVESVVACLEHLSSPRFIPMASQTPDLSATTTSEQRRLCDSLVLCVIQVGKRDSYANIIDFDWFLSLLLQISHTKMFTQGNIISKEIIDITLRVKALQPFSVSQMATLLKGNPLSSTLEGGFCEVLGAAAWIVGELHKYLKRKDLFDTIEVLLQPRVVALPPHIQSIFLHASLKLFVTFVKGYYPPGDPAVLAESAESEPASSRPSATAAESKDALEFIKSRLPFFTNSLDLEVQERACFVTELLRLYEEDTSAQEPSPGSSDIISEIALLFSEELVPVAEGAQRKVSPVSETQTVPVPAGLDLDAPINPNSSIRKKPRKSRMVTIAEPPNPQKPKQQISVTPPTPSPPSTSPFTPIATPPTSAAQEPEMKIVVQKQIPESHQKNFGSPHRDTALQVVFAISTVENFPDCLVITLLLKNLSPYDLSRFEFQIVGDTWKFMSNDLQKFEQVKLLVHPQNKVTCDLLVTPPPSINTPKMFKGVIRYAKILPTHPSSAALEFEIPVPVSATIQCAHITKPEWQKLEIIPIIDAKKHTICTQDPEGAIQKIAARFHLCAVSKVGHKFYGKSFQGSQVFMVIKTINRGTDFWLVVQIKSTDSILAQSLVEELKSSFGGVNPQSSSS